MFLAGLTLAQTGSGTSNSTITLPGQQSPFLGSAAEDKIPP
jgi:hypothetical protein